MFVIRCDCSDRGRSLVEKRYAAFISYSQKDAKHAKKLHSALEAYRIPSDISGTKAKQGLGRFFRDDDELSASASLGAALEGAISDSKHLIVVCSPNSASSPWVNMEVRQFKRRGEGKVFAVIIDGEPHAKAVQKECFCPALKEQVDAAGNLTGILDEPLAPRWKIDGLSRVTTRIAAGILGVSYDTLWRREVRRRRKNLVLQTTGAAIVTALTVGLGYAWMSERQLAENERNTAAASDMVKAAGEGRVQYFADNIEALVDPSNARFFENELRTVATWLRPARSQVAELQGPRVLEFQGRPYFLNQLQGLSQIAEIVGRPERIIQPNDETIIVIGRYRTLVIDTKTGRRLSSQVHSDITFTSHAFRSREGSTTVLGVKHGSTNGSIDYVFLSVSADGQKTSLHSVAGFVTLEGVSINQECDKLTIKSRGSELDLYLLSAEGASIAELTPRAPGSIEIWTDGSSSDGYRRSDPFSSALGSFGAQEDAFLKSPGCTEVLADSADPSRASSAVKIASVGGQDGSPDSGSWMMLSAREALPLYRAAAPPDDDLWLPPPNDVDTFYGHSLWRNAPAPRGSSPEAEAFDEYRGTRIAIARDFANAGVTWHVCTTDCISIPVLHSEDTSYEVVRSPNGRYLFFAQAGTILDLADLELKTGVRELPSRGNMAFDFDPEDNQLAFVLGGEIIKYGPSANPPAHWRRSDQSAIPTIRPDQAEEDAFVGLIAMGQNQYVVAERSGLVTRLDERGAVDWQIEFAGIGELISVSYSAQRELAALVGTAGIRVIQLESGLALSGVLVPREWPEYRSDLRTCLSGIHLSDDGRLTLQCYAYGMDNPIQTFWRKSRYSGDLERWLDEISCPYLSSEETAPERFLSCAEPR